LDGSEGQDGGLRRSEGGERADKDGLCKHDDW
jgi:hypothetical protein